MIQRQNLDILYQEASTLVYNIQIQRKTNRYFTIDHGPKDPIMKDRILMHILKKIKK